MAEELKQTLRFFALTYFLSWLFWTPVAVAPEGIAGSPYLMVLYVLGGFGPSLSAVLYTYRLEGGTGVRKILGRVVQGHFSFSWYLVSLLLMPLILIGALGVHLAAGGAMPDSQLLAHPAAIIPTFLIGFFFGGAVSEEFGWRGFALGRLLKHYSAWKSSLLLGVVWGFWHTPLFLVAGVSQERLSLTPYIINVVLLSFLFTWLHQNTQGNIMMALLLHASVNLSYGLIPLLITGDELPVLLVTGVVVVGLLIAYGPEQLTREGTGSIAASTPP